jgi:hypothetical protein
MPCQLRDAEGPQSARDLAVAVRTSEKRLSGATAAVRDANRDGLRCSKAAPFKKFHLMVSRRRPRLAGFLLRKETIAGRRRKGEVRRKLSLGREDVIAEFDFFPDIRPGA